MDKLEEKKTLDFVCRVLGITDASPEVELKSFERIFLEMEKKDTKMVSKEDKKLLRKATKDAIAITKDRELFEIMEMVIGCCFPEGDAAEKRLRMVQAIQLLITLEANGFINILKEEK